METKKISVVVPNRNGEATLGECLEAVFRSGYGNFEVVLVDDASTDGSLEVAARFPCTVVRNEECLGAAASRNAGARAATGEILLFTDADVILPSDALSRVAGALEDEAAAGVVGLLSPKLRFRNLSSQYKNLYMHTAYLKLPDRVTVFYTSCAAIRKSAFEALGGFDEHYRHAGIEDMEFGVRATREGYVLRIDRGLQVEHVRHYTLRGLLLTAFRRASGTTRILLRDRLRNRGTVRPTTSPVSFVASIALTHLALPLLVLAVLFGSGLLLSAFLVTVLGVLVLNAGFLNAIRRFNGRLRCLGCIPVLFMDLYAHGLGNIAGLIGYVVGKEY